MQTKHIKLRFLSPLIFVKWNEFEDSRYRDMGGFRSRFTNMHGRTNIYLSSGFFSSPARKSDFSMLMLQILHTGSTRSNHSRTMPSSNHMVDLWERRRHGCINSMHKEAKYFWTDSSYHNGNQIAGKLAWTRRWKIRKACVFKAPGILTFSDPSFF
jgi:hypothetical protein